MKKKLDSITCAFGARQIAAHLNALSSEIEGAKSAKDIEHIHQLRVYSRRLRSALPIFEGCLPKKLGRSWFNQIKKITRSMGKARDLDVQIEYLIQFNNNLTEKKYKVGIDRLILRLSQKREKSQSKVIQSLEALEAAGTISEIRRIILPLTRSEDGSLEFSVDLYHMAYESIYPAWQSFMAYEEHIAFPEKVKELHEMRIAAKSLRYIIEIFAPLYKSKLKLPYQTVRKSQEHLGQIHDLDVWIDFIPTFIQQETEKTQAFYGKTTPLNFVLPGLTYFQEQVHSQREQAYQQFLMFWQEWKEAGVWEELVESIHMPSYPKDAIKHDISPELAED